MFIDQKPSVVEVGSDVKEVFTIQKNRTEQLFQTIEFDLKNGFVDLAKTDLQNLRAETGGLYDNPDPLTQFNRQLYLDHLYDAKIAELENNPTLAHIHARGVLLSLSSQLVNSFPEMDSRQAAPINDAWDMYVRNGLKFLSRDKLKSVRQEATNFLLLTQSNHQLADRVEVVKQQLLHINSALST